MIRRLLRLFKNRSSPDVYALIITTIGLVLVFLVPPFQAPDEQTHFYRAYQLAEGDILADKLSYGAGDILPTSLSTSFQTYDYLLFNKDAKVEADIFFSSLNTPLAPYIRTETRFENTAAYAPIPYLPQITAITVGKLFSFNPIIILYMARLAVLAAWVGMLWFAMRRCTHLALPLFAFALLPIVTFQAASASADTMTAGLALVFCVEIFRLMRLRHLTQSRYLFLGGVGILLALSKLPYVLLIGLVFLLPARLFVTRKQELIIKASIVTTALLLAISWFSIAGRTFVNLRAGVDTASQINFIVEQPLSYLKILATTYLGPQSDDLYIQMIGRLGWLDTPLPLWSLFIAALTISLAIIVTPANSPYFVSRAKRAWAIIVGIGIIICIATLLYLTWNSPKAPIIEGLQGRYYTPLFGIILLALGGMLRVAPPQYKRLRHIVYLGLTIVSCTTLITLAMRYYAW